MSLKRIYPAVVLALTAVAPLVRAQVPTIPGGVPGIGAGATSPLGTSALAAPTGLTGVTGAAPQSIWGFFGLSKANCAACKAQLCNSPIGQMMNGALGPVSAISGGMIPQFCPTTPSAADIAALEKSGASPAVITAAKIKADEADAKARVAAVEYLGTVDCNYWPEAQKALLTALRKDRNECVRYAAARVLSNGCCCGKETIRSLTITVMGQGAVGPKGKTEDGEPPESSERVRCAAMVALQTCVANAPPEPEPPVGPGEGPFSKPPATRPEGPSTSPSTSLGSVDENLARSAFLKTLARKPMSVVVNDARIALQVVGKQEPVLFTTGNRSLMNAIARARTTPKSHPAHAPGAPGAVGLLESPSPSAAHVHSPSLNMTPPPVPDGPKAAEVSPTPPANPSEPMDLPPLPANNPVEQAPLPSPVPPATPLAPGFGAVPISSIPPISRAVPVDTQVQLAKTEQEYLPPLPANSTTAPNLQAAVPGLLPATYKPAYYPQAVARSAPAPRPRQDAKITRASATSESDAALYERFRRDPDSFRGDFPR